MIELGMVAAAVMGMIEPTCHMPPTGASQACIDCYDTACDDYLDAWDQCQLLPPAQRPSCRADIKATYLENLEGCACPVVAAFVKAMPRPVGLELLALIR